MVAGQESSLVNNTLAAGFNHCLCQETAMPSTDAGAGLIPPEDQGKAEGNQSPAKLFPHGDTEP